MTTGITQETTLEGSNSLTGIDWLSISMIEVLDDINGYVIPLCGLQHLLADRLTRFADWFELTGDDLIRTSNAFDGWPTYFELLEQVEPFSVLFEGEYFRISPLKLFERLRKSLIQASFDTSVDEPYMIIQAVIDRTFEPLYREDEEIQQRLKNIVKNCEPSLIDSSPYL